MVYPKNHSLHSPYSAGPAGDRARFLYLCVLALLAAPLPLSAVPPLEAVLAAQGSPRGGSAGEARTRLLAAAGQYRGVPYRYGGMDRRGLDCSGFIYLSFRDALAVEVPRTVRTLYGWVEKIPDKQLRPGDLVFFRTAGAAAGVSHAGIYTGDGRFIHAASDGLVTGVIYSRLSEAYWQRTYAGAGRALPEGTGPVLADGGDRAGGGDRADAGDRAPGGDRASGGDRARGPLIGAALALSWNTFPEAGSPLRGASLEVRGAYDIGSGDDGLRLGLELRPQWDGTLGVFRLPLTLSLGFGDIIRVFAGPALTLGDPVLPTAGGDRRYTGGSAWFGTFGVMTAPFSVSLGRGALSLYGEIAWESFRREPSLEEHGDADLGAALRVSLGLRYTWGL